MTNSPRPALRKAADAHVHPAAPHHPRSIPAPRSIAPVVGLPGPLRGATSDVLRVVERPTAAGRAGRKPPEKLKPITVQLPRSLRKEFRAALAADSKKADDVVVALIRSWLDR